MNVPDGWFNYSRFGSPIDSTRIVAVKTPLKKQFHTDRPAKLSDNYTKILKGVPIEEEFTPNQMLTLFKERGWNVGLVIDLTFTKRYYEPKEFLIEGVKHLKIKCPGQVIPPDHVYHELSTGISEFLSDPKNKNSLVAVHCTHGLNRTGYLICRYLMDRCGYGVEAAIEAFNKGRGCCIERESYLEHLRNRANSSCSRDDTTRDRQPRPDCTTTTVHTSYHHHHRHHHQQQVQQQYGEWRGRPSEMVADRGRRDRYGGREDRRHGGKSDSSEYDLRSKLTGNSSRTVGRDEGYCDQHVRRREWSSGGNRKRACYMDDDGYHGYGSNFSDDTWGQPAPHTSHESAPTYQPDYPTRVDTWAGTSSYHDHTSHNHDSKYSDERRKGRKRAREETARR